MIFSNKFGFIQEIVFSYNPYCFIVPATEVTTLIDKKTFFVFTFFCLQSSQRKSREKVDLGRCYKTFYDRNLRIFVKARAFDPGEPL